MVGIDFGTSKCAAATCDGAPPRAVLDRYGHDHMPSLLLVSPDGELAAGWEAMGHRRRYDVDWITVNSIKRFLRQQRGRSWPERPHEVAALVLSRLRLELVTSLGASLRDAVIAIPAHFSINQRWVVRQAAELAGFRVARLLNEATAAGLRYAERHPMHDEYLLVIDFGGGTLDASLVFIGGGVYEVKAVAGDDRLGGDDFDKILIDLILEHLATAEGPSFCLATGQQTVLREAATRAKLELSSSPEARILLPGFLSMQHGMRSDVDIRITADYFRSLSGNLLNRLKLLLERVLTDASLTPADVHAVLLTGGTCRMPAVRDVVRGVLGPKARAFDYSDTGVAEGAAILAATLQGRRKDVLLLDVCPSSLGIETTGGKVTAIVPRNTTIPTKHMEIFSTTQDNQTSVTVRVLQGESAVADENETVGILQLSQIPPAPAGRENIEVTFEIDSDGVAIATALHRTTGRRQTLEVVSPSRLTAEEMKRVERTLATQVDGIRSRIALAAG